jgi:Flp pilus assembly protein TadD
MAEAHNAAGIVLEARGDLDGAERLYEQAASLDPDLAEPRQHLRRIRLRRQQSEKAGLGVPRGSVL